MKYQEAIKIMQTEKACVLRNENNECDRHCERCDLVLPTQNILNGYDTVIEALELLDKAERLRNVVQERYCRTKELDDFCRLVVINEILGYKKHLYNGEY